MCQHLQGPGLQRCTQARTTPAQVTCAECSYRLPCVPQAIRHGPTRKAASAMRPPSSKMKPSDGLSPVIWQPRMPTSECWSLVGKNSNSNAGSRSRVAGSASWQQVPQKPFARAHKRSRPGADFVDVDLEYPDEVHEKHKDYPLAPQIMNVTADMLSETQKEIYKSYNPYR